MTKTTKIVDILAENISVPEARDFLRITDGAEDNYIQICIESAFGYIENYLGYAVNNRVMEMSVSDYDGETLYLSAPFTPADYVINSVTGPDGAALEYTLDGNALSVSPGPVTSITVIYTVLPNMLDRKHIQQAAYLLIGKFFEQRGDNTAAQTSGAWETVDRLLSLVSIIWI